MFDDKAKALFVRSGRKGCLLIHGITGSPAHMLPLAHELAKQGWTVNSILLSGHAETVSKLRACRAEDWLRDAEAGYGRLISAGCDKIAVIGLSMGALLALWLAAKKGAAACVTLSAPVRVRNRLFRAAPTFRRVLRGIRWRGQRRGGFDQGYDTLPIESIIELGRVLDITEARLAEVQCPLLIVQSGRDRLVSPRSVLVIERAVSSERIEKLTLEKSGHVATIGSESKELCEAVTRFLKSCF